MSRELKNNLGRAKGSSVAMCELMKSRSFYKTQKQCEKNLVLNVIRHGCGSTNGYLSQKLLHEISTHSYLCRMDRPPC